MGSKAYVTEVRAGEIRAMMLEVFRDARERVAAGETRPAERERRLSMEWARRCAFIWTEHLLGPDANVDYPHPEFFYGRDGVIYGLAAALADAYKLPRDSNERINFDSHFFKCYFELEPELMRLVREMAGANELVIA